MPSIHGSLDNGQPLVPVLIASAFSPNAFRSAEFQALIDTGATKTCITRTVVEYLDLLPHSKILVATPSGLERRKAYAFALGFFNDGDGDGGLGTPRAPYYVDDLIIGADFVKNSNFDVLLGMDVISQGRLIIERGQFTFTF